MTSSIVALPSREAADNLRPTPCHRPGRNCLCPICGEPASLLNEPKWPCWPVNTPPVVVKPPPFGLDLVYRDIVSGDRVAFTIPCDRCSGVGLDLSPESIMATFAKRMDGAPAGTVGVRDCSECDSSGVVAVFSAEVNIVLVYHQREAKEPEPWWVTEHIIVSDEGRALFVHDIDEPDEPNYELPADLPWEGARYALFLIPDTLEEET